MNLHAAEMQELARKLWGEPNRARSTRTELRYGKQGSKSLKLATGEWFDHETQEGGGFSALYERVHGTSPPNGGDHNNNIAATYDYKDETGKLIYQVVRKIPKEFRQRRPDGNGGWLWNLKGVKPVLYRLPELLSADPAQPVWVVEGEKDCDALHERGLIATCNSGGARKWSQSYGAHLRDRHVIVLPDNDEDGRAHAAAVERMLKPHAASIRVLALPNLPDKGDVSDWLAAGGTAGLLMEYLTAGDDPEEREGDTKPNGAAGSSESVHEPQTDIGFSPSRFVARDPSLILPRSFLIGTRLIVGKVTGGAAPGGAGKTTFGLTTGISIVTGLALTGEPVHKTGPVLIICNEEDREELERRIHAICIHFKIDPKSLEPWLHILTGFEHMTKAIILQNGAMLQSPDIPALAAYIREHLIIHTMIDPFVTTHDGEENDNKLIDQAVREFAHVAHATPCSIDLLHHIVKSSDPEAHAGDISKARGAGSFGAAIRSAYTVAEMGPTSGNALDIPETDWPRFCRVDDGKANYSLKSREPTWFYRETVRLPNGDAVGIVRPFDMSQKKAEAARAAEAEKEPEREDIAQIVARAMPEDRIPLHVLLPVVEHARDVKARRARVIIEEAIPEAPGAREIKLDGQTVRIWRVRTDPKQVRQGILVVRQAVNS